MNLEGAPQVLAVGKNSRSTVRCKDKLGEGDNSPHDASSRVECNNGQPVTVERAMYWNSRGAGTDTIGGYAD